MLEFLLKYDPAWFSRGHIVIEWQPQTLMLAIAGAVAVLAGLALISARARGAQLSPPLPVTAGSVLLRSAAVAVALFVLARPSLVVELENAVRGTVAVLIDDSLSLGVAAGDDEGPEELIDAALGEPDGSLLAALRERFDLELFRFGASTQSITSTAELSRSQNRSDLAGGLRHVADVLRDQEPAAVIVISDGAMERRSGLSDAVAGLSRAATPIHAVHIAATAQPDLELSSVSAPLSVLPGERVPLRVLMRHRDLAGRSVRLRVAQDGVLLAQRQLELPENHTTSIEQFELKLLEPRDQTLEVEAQLVGAQEAYLENNRAEVLVKLRQRELAVLHYEGEPRFEVKFTRRALSQEPQVRLTSLIRTAENKHYRLGVTDADQLKEGFPRRAEDLFEFDVLILGSVARSELDPEQQALVAQFVAKRGGGLLALGGHSAFNRGGYAEQPLAKVLPVALNARTDASGSDTPEQAFLELVQLEPTPYTASHPITRLSEDDEDEGLWDRLPPLTVVNPLTTLKPGATALLTGTAPGSDTADELNILAVQRFGLGRVASFAVRDSWRWQINQAIPVDDQTHERLWANFIRWLGAPSRSRTDLRLIPAGAGLEDAPATASAAAGQEMAIVAHFADAAFDPAVVTEAIAQVTSPLGDIESIPLVHYPDENGAYRASFVAGGTGIYEVRVRATGTPDEAQASAATAPAPAAYVHTASAQIHVTENGREAFGQHVGETVMSELAQGSGGQYFTLREVVGSPDDLASRIEHQPLANLSERKLPLWDAPVWLMLILGLLSIEWLLRRGAKLR